MKLLESSTILLLSKMMEVSALASPKMRSRIKALPVDLTSSRVITNMLKKSIRLKK
jgi:hypothetical protein